MKMSVFESMLNSVLLTLLTIHKYLVAKTKKTLITNSSHFESFKFKLQKQKIDCFWFSDSEDSINLAKVRSDDRKTLNLLTWYLSETM